VHKVPDKPSHITKAYQNASSNLTVKHKDMSIRKIYQKNCCFNSVTNCTTDKQKTTQTPPIFMKNCFQTMKLTKLKL
jgi:hypothetical protein